MARPVLPDCSFWRHVAISPFGEACWPWKGDVDENGRARTRFRGKSSVLVYRVAFQLEFGEIPEGMGVLHTCDWPRCCNPRHLFAGSQLENMRDMYAKGRAGDCRNFGEEHGRCIVTDAQIEQMKNLYAMGRVSQTKLALMFRIGQTQVSRILRGESRAILTAEAPVRRKVL